MTAFWLRLLLAGYFPFLAVLTAAMLGVTVWVLMVGFPCLGLFLVPVVLFLVLPLLQIVWACRVLFLRLNTADEMELRVPRARIQGLYDLTEQVARDRRLSMPAEIRLVADDVAHVYEESDGRRVLVIGGLAMGLFSQAALAGVIAHELAHFAAGDTRLFRRAFRRHLLMAVLEETLRDLPAAKINPLVWLIHGYHLVYHLTQARHSRQQEYAADRHEVKQAGKQAAAAALILVTVTHRLPYVRLFAIAEACVATNQPMEQIFAEQARRAGTVSPGEWDEACRKVMDQETEWFDTHPALRDRLKALGVPPRKALKLALDQTGPPARDLVPEWPAIERKLTERLIHIVRVSHLTKQEIGQILLGRPLHRP